MFNRIVLAAEDLDHAKKAARTAGNAARILGASELCIVVAYPSVPEYLGTPEAEKATAERMSRAEEVAGSLRQEVGPIPCEIQTTVLEGSVSEVALRATEVRGGDLIVLGRRGPGLLGRIKAWFRAERILQGAPCPVMLVQ